MNLRGLASRQTQKILRISESGEIYIDKNLLVVDILLPLTCYGWMWIFSFFYGLATWHQFDGVSYIYTEKGWWDSFKEMFRSEQTAQNRTTALLAYLPKWRGFVVGRCEEKMKATEAIVKLDKVVDCLTNVWIQFSSGKPERRKPPDFNIDKVNCIKKYN